MSRFIYINFKYLINNFWYIFIFLKDKILFTLTFLNRSFILFMLKKFSDKSKISPSYEGVFNSAECLTCYAPWLLLVFEYKREHKSCVTNVQTSQYYFFHSGFSLWFQIRPVLLSPLSFDNFLAFWHS